MPESRGNHSHVPDPLLTSKFARDDAVWQRNLGQELTAGTTRGYSETYYDFNFN